MAIIVEDGSIVANANSYLEIAEANTLLLETFGITATVTEANLKASAQYLETLNYQGRKTDPVNQSLQWPRTGACVENVIIQPDSIPELLKRSQALGAYYESQNQPLLAVSNGQTITSKSIDGVGSFGYGDNGENSAQMKFSLLQSNIKPLLKPFGVFHV